MKKVVKGLVTLLLLVLCITRTFSTVVVASASHKNDIVIDAQSDETQELAISFIGGFEDGGWDYTSSSSDLVSRGTGYRGGGNHAGIREKM